jgi:beta-lactamase class A
VTPLGDLGRQLDALCDERPYRCTWVLRDVREGGHASRGPDDLVPAASTRKVAIMVAALVAVARRELDLEQPVVIDERYRDQVYTGTLQHLSPGLTLPLRDAIALMIMLSDNLSTAHVVDVVGLDAVNRLCEGLGLGSTVHRHALIPALPPDHSLDDVNVTSAGDQAALYAALLEGSRDEDAATRIGCGMDLCVLALRLLSAQQHRDLIPALLPLGTTVAHKTGLGWRDVSDGGVVYREGEPRFILTAYADGVPESIDGLPGIADAKSLIARLSRNCWDALA